MDPRIARSREAVMEATLKLLQDRGFSGTSIDAISESSGVAKTTIYRHWRSKAEVVLESLAELIEAPQDPDTGELRQDLYDLVGGLGEALARSRWAALMPSLIEAAEHDPEFAELHRSFSNARHRAVGDVIVRGIGRGELPRKTDVDEVQELLVGPLFYRRLMSEQPVDEAYGRRVVDLVLAAYQAQA